MDPEYWQQIKILLHSALERPPAERPAFLDQACSGNRTLRSQLEALLASHERTDDFIELPAFEVMAEQTAQFLRSCFSIFSVFSEFGPDRMCSSIGSFTPCWLVFR